MKNEQKYSGPVI